MAEMSYSDYYLFNKVIIVMDIRGMVKFSLLDFPGKVACIIFTSRCNFRCPFCHNPVLIFDPESQPQITETEFFHFLDRRVGKLDGVVITGGEPTLQSNLSEFCRAVKAKGFAIKLDTNGSNPELIKRMLDEHLIDAFGLDYKAPSFKYAELTCCRVPELAEKVQTVIRMALAAGIPADVRTTVHRDLLSPEDLAAMRLELDGLGVRDWTLQQFNPVEVIDDKLPRLPTYSDEELLTIARAFTTGRTRLRGLRGIVME